MALGKNAKIELLKRVPLFAGCTKAELRELAATADEVDLREGTVLTKEGASAHEFFVLERGRRGDQGGRKVGELNGGDWLGEIALLTEVATDGHGSRDVARRLLVITDRAFKRLVKEMPSIAIKVLTSVADRLARDTRSYAVRD